MSTHYLGYTIRRYSKNWAGLNFRLSESVIFKGFYLLVFSGLLLSCSPPRIEKPNIILIMADDLGYGDIASFGNENISTPALDKMAREGMKFTDFHSNGSVCSPTRAALLTGRYQQRSGMEGVIYAKGETRAEGLGLEELTVAEYLKRAGYVTGIIGKWHLGYYIDYNPLNQGFDYFRGYVSGNIDYHSHIDGAGIPDWWHDLEKAEEEGYVTDLITDYTLDFIRKNKDRHFFLYVSQEAPHYPFQGRSEAADRTVGGDFPHLGSREDRKAAYKEMIEVMDEGIGDILTLLEELDIDNHTLMIFCSDNGGFRSAADNGVLRGSKGGLWEGGHRVPAIARWPGYIKPGSVSDELIMSMDFFPTFVNLSQSKEVPEVRFDGVDITQLLTEERELPDRTVFWRYRNQKAARNGDWKLMINADTVRLYNLRTDIEEQTDLSEREPEITEQLKKKLDSWERDVAGKVRMKTE